SKWTGANTISDTVRGHSLKIWAIKRYMTNLTSKSNWWEARQQRTKACTTIGMLKAFRISEGLFFILSLFYPGRFGLSGPYGPSLPAVPTWVRVPGFDGFGKIVDDDDDEYNPVHFLTGSIGPSYDR